MEKENYTEYIERLADEVRDINSILYDVIQKISSEDKEKWSLKQFIDYYPDVKYMVGGCIINALASTKRIKLCKMPYLRLEFARRGWTLLKQSDFRIEPPYEEWKEQIIQAVESMDSKRKKKKVADTAEPTAHTLVQPATIDDFLNKNDFNLFDVDEKPTKNDFNIFNA